MRSHHRMSITFTACALMVTTIGVQLLAPPASAGTGTPSVSSGAPTAVPITGGTQVTLFGSQLDSADSVRISSTEVGVGYHGFAALTGRAATASFIAPALPRVGRYIVELCRTTNGAHACPWSAYPSYILEAQPVVDEPAVKPDVPLTGGGPITVTGVGFTGLMSVDVRTELGGVMAPMTDLVVTSDTSFTAMVPARRPAGDSEPLNVGLDLHYADGLVFLSPSQVVRWIPRANVIAVTPPIITAGDPTPLHIDATPIDTLTSVRINGQRVDIVPGSITSNSVDVIPPLLGAGPYEVSVTTTGGVGTATDLLTVQPKVSTMTPAHGSVVGGDAVTLTGQGFTQSGVARVFGAKIGANSTRNFRVVDDTTATFTAPQGAAFECYPLSLTYLGADGHGSSTIVTESTVHSFCYGFGINSITPVAGPLAGGTQVTIRGSGFLSIDALYFADQRAAISVPSDNLIVATVPPTLAAGQVDIRMAVRGREGSRVGVYTYMNPPVVTGVSPASGPLTPIAPVVVTGRSLDMAMGVKFGALPGTIVSSSNNAITVLPPAAVKVGAVPIVVVGPGGTVNLAGAYTYFDRPVLARLTPAIGTPGGGTVVTLRGSNLLGATEVKFGTTKARSFRVVSTTQITTTAPAGAAYSTASISVTTPTGTATLKNAYRFGVRPAPPVVAAVSPDEGPTEGGTHITITGSGFTGATRVAIGGIATTSFSVVSDDEITAVTGRGESGYRWSVDVTTPGGTNTISATFHYLPIPPSISSITPASGCETCGTAFTITGVNLLGPTAVTVDGASTSFIPISPSEIRAVAPIHGAGPVDIGVQVWTGEWVFASSAFTYTSDPAPAPAPTPATSTLSLASVNPSWVLATALVGSPVVTITGTGFTNVPATWGAVKFSKGGFDYSFRPSVINDTTMEVTLGTMGTTGFYDITVTDSLAGSANLVNGFELR